MIHGHGGNIWELAAACGCAPAEICDMSSNVNPLGPPPGLMAHLESRLGEIVALPEADAGEAVRAFARFHDISPNHILAANGTTQLIHSLPPALQARRAVIVGPTYADYGDACRAAGVPCSLHACREADHFLPDPDALRRALSGADLAFICNPNNPTGVLMPREALLDLCRARAEVRFVIDESYLPFVPDARRRSLMDCGLENVLVLNSMSKIFRIPGLRIGFMVGAGAPLDALRSSAMPWNVNSLAQAAVTWLMNRKEAVEAFVAESCAYLAAERGRMRRALEGHPLLRPFESHTSFILLKLQGATTPAVVCAAVGRERILIRDCSNFAGLPPEFVRISLKTTFENQRLRDVLWRMAPEG